MQAYQTQQAGSPNTLTAVPKSPSLDSILNDFNELADTLYSECIVAEELAGILCGQEPKTDGKTAEVRLDARLDQFCDLASRLSRNIIELKRQHGRIRRAITG